MTDYALDYPYSFGGMEELTFGNAEKRNISLKFDKYPYISNPRVCLYKNGTGTDISASYISGSPTISGNVVSIGTLGRLPDKNYYVLDVSVDVPQNQTIQKFIKIDVPGMGRLIANKRDFDALWDKMYVHAKKVIVPCRYCGSHNAYTNATCVKCGAPMGETQ